jgi:hypothetical protein
VITISFYTSNFICGFGLRINMQHMQKVNYLNEELPVVGAVAEDIGRAGRSCRGKARESSLAVVVVTSKLRLALEEDP